ncbi:MAG: hypothetical protein Q3988_05250 [Gemella sp.]|nr:hypothetical protein [Gemella sp.]
MERISRRWEKMIAWFANIVFIIATAIAVFFGYFGSTKMLVELPGVQEEVYDFARNFHQVKPELVGATINMDEVANLMQTFFKYYSVFLLVILLIAVIATASIEKRALSITLFVVAAVAVSAATLGALWFISLAYLVVVFLLIVRSGRRKEKRDLYAELDEEISGK